MTPRNKKYTHWILFFVWPLGALMNAISNGRQPWAKNILWAFIIFFGFTFVIPNDGVDANRYRDNLVNMHSQRDLSWSGFIGLLYVEGTNFLDVFQPLITFFISRFTDSQRVLFSVFGLVFGFFYSRNLAMIMEQFKDRIPKKIWPLLILFAMLVAFWQINGFRFWTATHMLLYGGLLVILYKKPIGYLFIFLTPLMHFAFIFPALIFAFYLVAGDRTLIYFALFILSLFFIQLQVDSFLGYLPQLPSVYQAKVSDYTGDQYLSRVSISGTGMNWYVTFRGLAVRYMMYVFLVLVFVYRRKQIREYGLNSLFSFALLFISIANITKNIPSFGRYLLVSEMFIAVLMILFFYYNLGTRLMRYLYPAMLMVIGLYVIVEIRFGMDFMSLATLMANPFIAGFFTNEVPLIEFIK